MLHPSILVVGDIWFRVFQLDLCIIKENRNILKPYDVVYDKVNTVRKPKSRWKIYRITIKSKILKISDQSEVTVAYGTFASKKGWVKEEAEATKIYDSIRRPKNGGTTELKPLNKSRQDHILWQQISLVSEQDIIRYKDLRK